MKKRMAAGLLLSLLCSGCAAQPAQNTGAALASQNPAETVMIKESSNPQTPQTQETLELEELEAKESETKESETKESEYEMTREAETTLTGAESAVEKNAYVDASKEPPQTDGFSHEPINEEVKQRIYGLSYKEDCTVPYEELRYVRVQYIDFDGLVQEGELICNKAIAQDLVEIFYELFQASYPIAKIRLIDEYNADDDLSCLDNNTSCFNYRVVGGSTSLSKHALGLAIDINPFYNPYVTYPNGVERISPAGSEPYADRSRDFPYKIDENDLCYQLFTAHGFTWGGHWKTLKDYQHFQKAL